jgi:hypothetical protein
MGTPASSSRLKERIMPYRTYYLLGSLEGIASFIWLINIPRNEGSSWFLGFSLPRWLMLGPIILISLVFLWNFVISFRKPGRKSFLEVVAANRKILVPVVLIIVFVLVYGVIGIILVNKHNFPDVISPFFVELDREQALSMISIYKERLSPIIFLIFALCTQTLLFLVMPGQDPYKKNEIIDDSFLGKNLPNVKEIISSKPDIVAIIMLSITMAVFICLPLQEIIAFGGPSDLNEHIRFAKETLQARSPTIPHFLFHLLVILIQFIPGVSFSTSALLVVAGFYTALSILVYFFIRASLGQAYSVKSSILSMLTSASLLIVAPISVFTSFENNLYKGYIGINTYHSPTIIVLKPFAILVFLYTMKVFNGQRKIRDGRVITAAGAITILSILVKPSYSICLLLALALFVIHRVYKKRPIDWWLLIFGIGIPSAIILGWQYYFYFAQNIETNIIFKPFEIYKYFDFSGDTSWLVPKFLLSISFPLCVYIIFFQNARRNMWLNFSWLAFFTGSFYSYFLVQSGPEMRAANFWWSAQIALFILFLVSARFFFRRCMHVFTHAPPKHLVKVSFALSIFGLHLISGVNFYYWHLNLSSLRLP